jgi:ABC-type uncharacterized transport system involved in gliding motility auxiliary subunit
VKEIPSTIDVLLVAQPASLTREAAYAIDQYALKGGKVLLFIDPFAEASHMAMLGQTGDGKKEIADLLKAWGVGFDPKKVATDIAHARRVQFGRQNGMVTEYVAWLSLDQNSIDQNDVLSNGIDTLNLASAGFLDKIDGAGTQVTPIISTSSEAMQVDVDKVQMTADPIALLRNYQAGGKPLVLAARISGEAKSAFPDGAPKADEAKKDDETKKDEKKPEAAEKKSDEPAKSHLASGRINAIVVADSDMLADQFWVETRNLLGQQMAIPTSQNAAFLLGALENLSGNDALIALRGRGIRSRPFTWVERIRRDAERDFREKEQTLTAKLQNLQGELQKLETTGEGGAVILTDTERQAIDKFRSEMLSTRRELRDVKLALRRDIDSLDGWLKFTNIALVPLAIGIGGIGWSLWRTRGKKPV